MAFITYEKPACRAVLLSILPNQEEINEQS